MSLDLVAVQRDAMLIDALAQRAWSDDSDLHPAADPVVGLLAALVADVDEGVHEMAGPDVVVFIPEQFIPEHGGRAARPGRVLALPLAPPPVGRRHVARAVAAMVVTAALLSVSGVAAAVSGDPLTPYKRVIDVVRSGYHEVAPKGLVAPTPKVVPQPAKTVTVAAVTRAAGARGVVVASRFAAGRRSWNGHGWDRSGWDRSGWDRNGSGRPGRDRSGWAARQRYGATGAGTARSSHNGNGQHWTWHRDGSGLSHGDGTSTSRERYDSGESGDRSGDGRR